MDVTLEGRSRPDPAAGEPVDAGGAGAPRPLPRGPLGRHWRSLLALGLALVVAFGIVLRFWTHSALWLDEALTVDIARLPLHDLHAALRRDGAPPLYYVLLHFWMGAFGTSDLAVRSLSGVLSVATLPVAWVAGRRIAGRSGAWIAVALLASAPFAIYYGTEARMYSLVMFLTACGLVALSRALERPAPGNLVAVGVVTAALLYSHYWALFLVGAVGLWLLWRVRPAAGSRQRRSAGAALAAVVVGCLAFVPWLPTFWFQAHHTGTPWAAPPNFGAMINAVTAFTDNQASLATVGTNQGRLLAVCYLALAFLGVFGVARDRWHIELDIRTRRPAGSLAFVVVASLGAAIAGGLLDHSGFSPRYASIVFVPFLLLVVLGAMTLLDRKVRTVVVAVAVAAGLALGVENVWTQRTQAPKVAAVLRAHARPGDVVAYCPDQLGPALYRLTASDGFEQVTFPRRTGPAFVNWIDYLQAAHRASPAAFAAMLEARAGSTHQIWLVWAMGYRGFNAKCQALASDLFEAPGYGAHDWVILNPVKYYEPMQLTQFAPPARGSPPATG